MKSLFFDWDGTLVDSIPMLFAAHNHVRVLHNLSPWTREEYAKAMIRSTRELYPSIYGEKALQAQTQLYDFIHENHLKTLTVIDGAADIVAFAAGFGVPMGVVSNKRDDVLKKEVEHLGWQKYFGVYIGAGVAVKDKPSGAPLLHALAMHPAEPRIEHVLYIGDTESDLACAADAGCKVAFIQHESGQQRPDLVAKYAPAYVVENTAALKHAIADFLAP